MFGDLAVVSARIAVALLQMVRHKQREAPLNPGTGRGRMPRTGSCGWS